MAGAFGSWSALLTLGVSGVAHAGVVWTVNLHEYEVFSTGKITWEDARVAAQALGPDWDLASIGAGQENAFVTSLLDAGLPDRAHFWIGAKEIVQIANGHE